MSDTLETTAVSEAERFDALKQAKIVEYAALSDAKLAKKIRHIRRTINRGVRTGFLQRTIDLLYMQIGIALAEANRRKEAKS